MVDLNTLIAPLSGWELLDASAINDAGQITGQGLIGGEYHAYLLTPIPILGDYNDDGTVDAADYVVWRKTDSGNSPGYTDWQENFGEVMGGGSAGASASQTGVPEPATLVLLIIAAAGWRLLRGQAALRVS
jgi:hypothetical protein